MQDNPGLPPHSFPAKHTIAHSFFFIFGRRKHLSFPVPFSFSSFPASVSFRWLMVLRQSSGPTVLSWCEPNPSGTQYPVYQLSALWKTTTILSRGRSSELITVCSGHSQGRSLFSVTPPWGADSVTAPVFSLFIYIFSQSICVFCVLLPPWMSSSEAAPLDNWPSPRLSSDTVCGFEGLRSMM